MAAGKVIELSSGCNEMIDRRHQPHKSIPTPAFWSLGENAQKPPLSPLSECALQFTCVANAIGRTLKFKLLRATVRRDPLGIQMMCP